MVRVSHLHKTFAAAMGSGPVPAVVDISFSIPRGEVFGLIGPNGSGKSTTIKILLGLVRASSGEARIQGWTPQQPEGRRRLGYLPEAPYFYQHLSARELLIFLGKLSGMKREEIAARSEPTLRTVGLLAAADRSIRTYSKGMLQRVGLAQALLHDPDLLILDEPTAGVDPVGAAEIARIVRHCKEEGKTVLLCSHLLSQVESVCDRVHLLHRGRTLLEGRVSDLVTVSDEISLVVRDPGGMSEGWETRLRQSGLDLVRTERPRRSLETLFMEQVSQADTDDTKPTPR